MKNLLFIFFSISFCACGATAILRSPHSRDLKMATPKSKSQTRKISLHNLPKTNRYLKPVIGRKLRGVIPQISHKNSQRLKQAVENQTLKKERRLVVQSTTQKKEKISKSRKIKNEIVKTKVDRYLEPRFGRQLKQSSNIGETQPKKSNSKNPDSKLAGEKENKEAGKSSEAASGFKRPEERKLTDFSVGQYYDNLINI